MRQKQQGDVTFQEIADLPEGCKKVEPTERGYVLREGEATGHAHRIEQTDVAELYEKDGTLYVRALRPVPVVHEEHHTQILEPMIWEVGTIKEYDYLTKMARPVKD